MTATGGTTTARGSTATCGTTMATGVSMATARGSMATGVQQRQRATQRGGTTKATRGELLRLDILF